MTLSINSDIIKTFRSRLENHPAYDAVRSIEDLQCFMEHHIYSVWDFMSLIKYLQSQVAPTHYPWIPRGNSNVQRFINELVLEEESDETMQPGKHSSHFELYLTAMQEIGANTNPMLDFVNAIEEQGLDEALQLASVRSPARDFTSTTFKFIAADKPHQVASALALGREHIIPCMFRSILKNIGVSAIQAPIFHYYLNRHIHLDDDFHAPLSLQLLNSLCHNQQETDEAIDAAHQAVNARIKFWDGVLEAINALK